MDEYPAVLVAWYDAWFSYDQDGAQSERDSYVVRSLGFLIEDTPTRVSIAGEILPDGDGFRAVTHIPRAILAHEPVPLKEEL